MTTLPLADILNFLPEIFLIASAIVLLIAGAFWGEHSAGWINAAALVALIVTAGLLIISYNDPGAIAFNNLYRADQFGRFMKLLATLGAALSLFMGRNYMRREAIARFEFPVLVLIALTGMFMMISANDLIALYVGLELQSLSLYIIAAFHRDDAKSTEAGLKYFVLGGLSSGILLYGATLVYGFTGATHFDVIAHSLSNDGTTSIGLIVGLVMVLAGIAFKISAVPFHMWTPDVYQGAPTPVTAFFAVAPKVAAIALLIRVLTGPFASLVHEWQQVIVAMAVLSMLLGSLAAISQRNIKRLMAYSSIGHIGYALIGIAAGGKSGIAGVMIYMAIYVAMNLGTFACILAMRVKGRQVEAIDDLSGLAETHPLLALALAIFMFSMAGIPPLAGFFSKLYIFLAAIEAKLYILAVIGVLTSVIGAYYYLRIIKVMYFDKPAAKFDRFDWPVSLVAGVAGIVNLFFVLRAAPLFDSATQAADLLFSSR